MATLILCVRVNMKQVSIGRTQPFDIVRLFYRTDPPIFGRQWFEKFSPYRSDPPGLAVVEIPVTKQLAPPPVYFYLDPARPKLLAEYFLSDRNSLEYMNS